MINYYYVVNTAISFEYSLPPIDEFKNRVKRTLEKYPYYVALIDDKIAGYIYAGDLNEREAYKYCAELSIHIDKDHKKQ